MLYSSMVCRWGSEDNENCFLLTSTQVWQWSTKLIIAAYWWVVVCAVGLQCQLAFAITWYQYLFDTKREFYARVSCFCPSFYRRTHRLNSVRHGFARTSSVSWFLLNLELVGTLWLYISKFVAKNGLFSNIT